MYLKYQKYHLRNIDPVFCCYIDYIIGLLWQIELSEKYKNSLLNIIEQKYKFVYGKTQGEHKYLKIVHNYSTWVYVTVLTNFLQLRTITFMLQSAFMLLRSHF